MRRSRLATAVLTPSTAQAFSISHFRVGRLGELDLKWEVTVCGARGYQLTFTTVVVRKGFPRSRRDYGTFHEVQRQNCSKWKEETEDIWIGGLPESQMTVYSRGQTHRTAWTVFDNGECCGEGARATGGQPSRTG